MTKRARFGFGTMLAGLIAAGCGSNGEGQDWKITSPAFADGAPLPAGATCDGKAFGTGVSPELNWTDGPDDTRSYALVFKDTTLEAATDPVAHDHAYHWAIWDIPATTLKLPASLGSAEFPTEVPGARQWSSVNQYGYLGSCPNPIPGDGTTPKVTDHYAFVLYAINVDILAYPADPAPGDNYVQPLDDYLKTHNIGKVQLTATSDAASTSFTPPATPAAPAARPEATGS
jgi:phosphatidylethanolamine-binding protein (PEBP) family uncharacterized protein